MTPLEKISKDLKVKLDAQLVDDLLKYYREIKESFYLSRHEHSELNAGKFAEICARILQKETGGVPTPVGTQFDNLARILKSFESLPVQQADEAYRIHIPRILLVMCNVRNKRGVAHPHGNLDPNYADATLVASCADWVMAELFRMHYNCPLSEAQAIADSLVQRRLLLVHEIDDVKRVLLPSMSPKDKILLLLYTEHPLKVAEAELLTWLEIGTKDRSNWRTRHFVELHKEKKIEYRKDDWVMILPPGISHVEANYQSWLDELNK